MEDCAQSLFSMCPSSINDSINDREHGSKETLCPCPLYSTSVASDRVLARCWAFECGVTGSNAPLNNKVGIEERKGSLCFGEKR